MGQQIVRTKPTPEIQSTRGAMAPAVSSKSHHSGSQGKY